MMKQSYLKSLVLVAALGMGGSAYAQAEGGQQGGIAFSTPQLGLGTAQAEATARSEMALRQTSRKKVAPVQVQRASPTPVTFTVTQGSAWMHSDVPVAWSQGFRGQGVTITVVDSFANSNLLRGNMTGVVESLSHGAWTAKQSGMTAPSARVLTKDFNSSGTAVALQRGFNVINMSYGIFTSPSAGSINWGVQERSLIAYARNGQALLVKAAGNDAVAVGAASRAGRLDVLNRDLIGAQSVLFVGALADNGAVDRKASLASYSNFAGSNPVVQNQFLVVGVKSSAMGLAGTSFAAPIVSGYAAILQSKFTSASHSQIANQLLSTARTDTIAGYSRAIHGRGEASISRALAPAAIR